MALRSRRLRACLIAAGLFALAAGPDARRQALPDLLGRYERGDFGVVASISSAADRNRTLRGFEIEARRWTDEAAASQKRRRLVAASLALEVAHAWVDDRWSHGRRLIVWARDLLRESGPPLP